MPGIDAGAYSSFSPYTSGNLSRGVLESMYANDWLAAKICNKPAQDATRKFIKLLDEDKKIEKELMRLGLRQKCTQAIQWARLFGGAGVVIVTDGDNREELDPAKVNKIISLDVYDRWYLYPIEYDQDPTSPTYMRPSMYQNGYGGTFHASRVMKFYGAPLTYQQMVNNLFWGGSLIQLYYQAVKNFQATTHDARFILSELNIGILKIPSLTAMQAGGANNPAVSKVQTRVNAFNKTKSNQRVAAIDKEEDFSFVNRTLTGLPEVMDRFQTQISAATDMGDLILFGKSVGGLADNNEGQILVYEDLVESIQHNQVAPAVDTILSCLTKGKEIEWEFKPLRQLTDAGRAEVMDKSANALQKMAETVGLTPEEARREANKVGVWDFEINEDLTDDGL